MKNCIHCKQLKELTEFYKHPQTGDGHLGACKECCKSRNRANRVEKVEYYRDYDKRRYAENPEAFKAVCKAYLQTPAGKVAATRATAKWYTNNPGAEKAHSAVGNAVRDGKLIKPEICSKCEEAVQSRNLHAHHEDYNKPLDVVWLCLWCHLEHHGITIEEMK